MNMSTEIPDDVHVVMKRADYAGPASEDLVAAVEGRLGIVFPKQYRAFLRQFGAALCGGFEIYGLVDAPPTGEPPIWSDLRGYLREEVKESLAIGLLPISDDGGDYRFLLRTDPKAESIVVYGPGLDRVEVTNDFFDFVVRAAREGISSLIPRDKPS
jgi:hypothetical protein